jgi:hypothetical protein
MSSDSVNLVPTQQSVKAYVDAVTTELQAQDLDFQADSGGALSIDLDSETLTFTGGTGIDTSGSGNAVTFAIDSTVATLTGTQTLTNKTLTSPDVNTPDIDGGTIDGTVIGGTTPAAVSATTVSATGNITVGGTVDGRDVATDGTKLDGIESGATADQTAAEIRTLVESATDSNVFTDADHTKLDGIEAGATGDQTNAEIRAAVEAATDSNVFTDADHSKLDGIEAGADVTDTTNVTAAGALMDSELTNITAVKSLDQGVATTDSPTFAGLTTTANVSFGDNDKAVFGAGNDLSVYHDGSNSYIKEEGTGNLEIGTNGGNITLKNLANSETLALFNINSGVNLYYDNSVKLETTSTGIDVTGNVDASLDLLVGGAVAGNAGTRTINVGTAGSVAGGVQIWAGTTQTSFLQFGDDSSISANHYRGYLSYNHSTDTLALGAAGSTKVSVTSTGIDVTGTVTADALTVQTAQGNIEIANSSAIIDMQRAGTNYILASNASGNLRLGSGNNFNRLDIANNGDISFYEDTGTTAKLFWDASAESLGIGTTSPRAVSGYNSLALDGSTSGLLDINTNGTRVLSVYGASNDINLVNPTSTGAMRLYTNDTERMRIDSSGNVDLYQGNNLTWRYAAGSTIRGSMSIDSADNITFSNTSSNTERMRIGSTGIIYVNGDGTGGRISGDGSGALVLQDGNGRQSFKILSPVSGNAQAMTLDASGNLLVGKTGTSFSTAGSRLTPDGGGQFIVNEAACIEVNRLSNDGTLVGLYKDGSSVGSIFNSGTTMGVGSLDTGVLLANNIDAILPWNASTNAERGSAIDLGRATTGQFKNLYLSGGLKVSNSSYDTGATVTTSVSGDLITGLADTALRFYDGGDAIIPRSTADAARNGTTDLGASNSRFKKLYLSSGVQFGTTDAAAELLDDYEEGTCDLTWSDGTNNSTVVTNKYTKVGRIVTVSGYVAGNVSGLTGTAVAKIAGFPFAFSDYGSFAVKLRYIDSPTGCIGIVGNHVNSGSVAQLSFIVDNGNYVDVLVSDLSTSSNDTYFNITYTTT